MKTSIFIFASLYALTGLAQSPAEYYQKQRDDAFKKYMETTGSASFSVSIKTSDWTIDPTVVQEMTDMWAKRNGRLTAEAAEKKRAEEAYARKKAEEKRYYDALAAQHKADAEFWKNWQRVDDAMRAPYVTAYTNAGFAKFEVDFFARRRVFNREYRDDAGSERALEAKQQFNEKFNTAPLDELLYLLSRYDAAGYTAMHDTYKLLSRFPEKRQVIENAAILMAMPYWARRNDHPLKAPGSNVDREMEYKFEFWKTNYPGTLLSTLIQYAMSFTGTPAPLEKWMKEYVETKDYEKARAFALAVALGGEKDIEARKGEMIVAVTQYLAPYKYQVVEKKGKRVGIYVATGVPERLFTAEDIEAVRAYHDIPGSVAMIVLGAVKFTGANQSLHDYHMVRLHDKFFYTKELKKYADGGDTLAKRILAKERLQMNEWGKIPFRSIAYEPVKLENGYMPSKDLAIHHKPKESHDSHSDLTYARLDRFKNYL